MKINYIITLIIACGSMALLPSHAQQVVVTDDGYAAISAKGYIRGVESNVSFSFEEVPLESLAATTKVKRQKRHVMSENNLISRLFAIAPTYIDIDGEATEKVSTTWAQAGGWSINANTTLNSVPQPASETGCPKYKGKDGNDTSGTWRLPTNRELHLMNLLKNAVEGTKERTNFSPYTDNTLHWSSTETTADYVYVLQIIGVAATNNQPKGISLSFRCVKDLPVPVP